TSELPQIALVEKMIGKELDALERLDEATSGEDRAALESGTPLVAADGLGKSGSVAPFSLTIHQGEVVGLAGLLGSGRTEVARLF
ncbi:sugar ABC transporter ATP-binding protein, partial [Streptomyces sp. NPDC052644]